MCEIQGAKNITKVRNLNNDELYNKCILRIKHQGTYLLLLFMHTKTA